MIALGKKKKKNHETGFRLVPELVIWQTNNQEI